MGAYSLRPWLMRELREKLEKLLDQILRTEDRL